MPLSQVQIQKRKNPSTDITFINENPKKAGTKSYERYEKYKDCVTVEGATIAGGLWQDLSTDFEKGHLKFTVNDDEQFAEPATAPKRSAPHGTPDREANARAKQQSTQVHKMTPDAIGRIPDFPVPEVTTDRCEMNPATIAVLRGMMKEEINNGIKEMEKVVDKKIATAVGEVRKEIKTETAVREELAARVA